MRGFLLICAASAAAYIAGHWRGYGEGYRQCYEDNTTRRWPSTPGEGYDIV